MIRRIAFLVVYVLGAIVLFALAALAANAGEAYVPPAGDAWETITPEEGGFDPAKLQAAVDFAIANETRFPPALDGKADARDLALKTAFDFAREPYSTAIGPFKTRAPANGLILNAGRIVAEWGATREVDMTFSITKTFLSSVAGVAFDKGMIRDTQDRVGDYVVPTEDFASPHNAPITWDQMLRQTSGWAGTLWDKPWWADRPGAAGDPPWSDLAKGPPAPGSAYEYNDVRVNALALALTHLWRRPLPGVLKHYVMDPIDASSTWHWEGYENSFATIGGRKMRVVPGGGHWGGGIFVSARDLARLGLLASRKGAWGEKRILSEAWIAKAMTPTDVEPGYGYMNWFLNTGRKRFETARADTVVFLGAGTNAVLVDFEHDTVAVVRWIDNAKLAEFVTLLMAARE